MNFQSPPVFIPPYELVLIIPVTVFAFAFVLLAHSLKSRKEILICRISENINKRISKAKTSEDKQKLNIYKDFMGKKEIIKRLRVSDLEKIEGELNLIRFFYKKYNIRKLLLNNDNVINLDQQIENEISWCSLRSLL